MFFCTSLKKRTPPKPSLRPYLTIAQSLKTFLFLNLVGPLQIHNKKLPTQRFEFFWFPSLSVYQDKGSWVNRANLMVTFLFTVERTHVPNLWQLPTSITSEHVIMENEKDNFSSRYKLSPFHLSPRIHYGRVQCDTFFGKLEFNFVFF